MTPPDLETAVRQVRERIAAAARRAQRSPDAVTLVAATKTVPWERVAEVVRLGVIDVGENRAQELLTKAPAIERAAPESTAPARWHFIGQLQRNKVRALAPWVSCWQSVDREALVATIAGRAPGASIFVEVNVAAEASKGGCEPAAVPALVDVARASGLSVQGLMTVPPHSDDPRPWFAALRDLAAQVEVTGLSMGMSEDFEAAVEEGATVVRVGRALFGDRPAATPARE
jgi:pyridoxal phosphate enzyme (YggS family)